MVYYQFEISCKSEYYTCKKKAGKVQNKKSPIIVTDSEESDHELVRKKRSRFSNEEEINNTIVDTELEKEIPVISGDRSPRVIRVKNDKDYIYEMESSTDEEEDFLQKEEDDLVILGNDRELENASPAPAEKVVFKSTKRNTKKNVESEPFYIPTVEECNSILSKTPAGSSHNLQELQFSYFGPLLEIVFSGDTTVFFHSVKEGENYKKRMLKTLILMPWMEIIKEGFEYI
jgi:hypothetical protein